MKTPTTKAVEKKQASYLRLESASNWQVIKSLWRRFSMYVLVLGIGLILGVVL